MCHQFNHTRKLHDIISVGKVVLLRHDSLCFQLMTFRSFAKMATPHNYYELNQVHFVMPRNDNMQLFFFQTASSAVVIILHIVVHRV